MLYAIVSESSKLAIVLYCLEQIVDRKSSIRYRTKNIMALIAIIVCALMQFLIEPTSSEFLLFKVIVLLIYMKMYCCEKLIHMLCKLFVLYVLADLLNFVVALITFPVVVFLDMCTDALETDLWILFVRIMVYIVFGYLIRKNRRRYVKNVSLNAQIGIIFICVILELSFLELKQGVYEEKNIMIHRLLIFIIIFGMIILSLWIFDKRQEQKKIQELTAYAHRTREVIPSVSRVLSKLAELSDYMDKSDVIVKELKSICDVDMNETRREAANIKSFNTTGSFMLDEQLERYLEEAAEQKFDLDIIVRAPTDEILESNQIKIYPLMQIIGDLYRNANKIVRKRKSGGHILICFGFNEERNYEISMYDNGEAFPECILERLGERGVTIDGTGHGLADVFEALDKCKASFILKQSLFESSIFTKGICIVFDNEGKKEVR